MAAALLLAWHLFSFPFHTPPVAAPSELFGRVNTGINFDNYDNIPVEASGENCPQPITKFDECNFADIVQENVKVHVHVYKSTCTYNVRVRARELTQTDTCISIVIKRAVCIVCAVLFGSS